MDDCIFCKIVKGNIPSILIYEDDVAKVILDRFPSTRGHLLIISKSHFENIFDVDEKVYAHIMKLAIKFSKLVKSVYKPDGINILQNNGTEAGQSVFHIHVHIIPRKKDDNISITWIPTEPTIEELMNESKRLINKLKE